MLSYFVRIYRVHLGHTGFLKDERPTSNEKTNIQRLFLFLFSRFGTRNENLKLNFLFPVKFHLVVQVF